MSTEPKFLGNPLVMAATNAGAFYTPEQLMQMHCAYFEEVKDINYVSRGSILWCSGGKRLARFDLPINHGIIAPNGMAVGDCADCKNNYNIYSFAPCQCPDVGSLPQRTKVDINVEKIDQSGQTYSVLEQGLQCIPMLTGGWSKIANGKSRVKIWDRETGTFEETIKEADTLTCLYGGYITVLEVPKYKGRQLVTLEQMKQVEGPDDTGKLTKWKMRELLTWNTSTFIPTWTDTRELKQSDIDALNKCLDIYDITGPQIAHFIAQISHESACGYAGIEKYDTDPVTDFGHRDVWRENFDDGDLAATDSIYNDDKAVKDYADKNGLKAKYKNFGAKYRGAGALQLTHYCGYKEYGEYLGKKQAVDEGAGFVAKDYFWDSAGWLWKCYYKMDTKFDNGASPSVEEITKKINGGDQGLAERKKFYENCKLIFPVAP